MACMRRLPCRASGLHKVFKQDASVRAFGSGDRWEPERLGASVFDPIEMHRSALVHRPGKVVPQKHTFGLEYFRSAACKNLLKVAWQGASHVEIQDGQFNTVAVRSIKAGEIVEKGILRGIGMGVLDDASPNQAAFKLGHDFLIGTSFPWGKYSDTPAPPFLASGSLMYYQKSASKANVVVSVKESPVEGFEFDVVAVEDIPVGAPLVRKVAEGSSPESLTSQGAPRYADDFHMSDEQVDTFLKEQREMDEGRAASAGVEPEDLHEDAIRKHFQQTRSGIVPPIFSDRTVTLPHPMWGGFGVFACEDIPAGEIVETGLHCKLNGLQGDKCPYVFTWNKGGQRYTDGRENSWATGSGNAMFYNSDHPSNVRMYRFIDQFRYIIVAKTDIKEGEEVMHLYASSSWRKCFVADTNLPKLLPTEES